VGTRAGARYEISDGQDVRVAGRPRQIRTASRRSASIGMANRRVARQKRGGGGAVVMRLLGVRRREEVDYVRVVVQPLRDEPWAGSFGC